MLGLPDSTGLMRDRHKSISNCLANVLLDGGTVVMDQKISDSPGHHSI